MINIDELRDKILNLAMQGKLTKRLYKDGRVEELYELIKCEKQKILTKRNGRDDKNIKAIDEDVPFLIPSQWKWIRLGEVGFFKKGPFGSALTKAMFVPNGDGTIKVYEQQHAIKKMLVLGNIILQRNILTVLCQALRFYRETLLLVVQEQ